MPTTQYLEIIADQQPIQYGVDENRRVLYSLNFSVRVMADALEVEEDMLDILLAADIPLDYGENFFIGENAEIPEGAGPYVTVLISGGVAPEQSHNNTTVLRPSVQFIIRASDYDQARLMAHNIFGNLNGKRNFTVER